jgi:small neutral amino acid transporter SnatA (MarC family)
MTLALLVVAAVCVVNPARVRSALPEDEAPLIAALGAAVALLALVPVAAAADPLVGALGLTTSTARMAVGVVLVVLGVVGVAAPPPQPEPRLPGRAAALVPIAFPVVCTPGLFLLVLSGSLDRSAPVALGVTALVLATIPALAVVLPARPSPVQQRVTRAAGIVLAGVLVLSGLGLVMDGVFDL